MSSSNHGNRAKHACPTCGLTAREHPNCAVRHYSRVFTALSTSVPLPIGMPLRYTAREMARMTPEHLLPIVLPLCPEVDEEIVRDFVQRMDEDYLNEIEPQQIASHIRLAARLDPDNTYS